MSGNPMIEVQELIGSVECWPTYILLHMFFEEPTTRVKQNVCAFMYGNRVPVYTAAYCYAMCRGTKYEDEIVIAVSALYKTWDERPWGKHLAEYYNTRDKRVYWL